MDWEKKFTSILNDTKANLSKVKNKYDSQNGMKNVTWAPKFYSTPMKRSTSVHDIPVISSTLYNQSLPSDFFTSTTNNSTMPYPSTQTLLEKLEKQNNDIDYLRGTVHRLETDRHNYKEQIRDLRNEIYQLTDKACERRPDPSAERRVEHIRRELLGEIQLLQSQIQMSSAKGDKSHLSDTQLLAMNRDVLEIKHAFRDELEGFRRDVEILRSRVSKMELELANMLSGKREVERRQDNLDRTINSLNLAQRKSQVSPVPSSATVAIMNTNRQLEKMQLNELRATLSALKDKIDVMERSSTPVSTSTRKSPVKPPVITNTIPPSLRTYDDNLLDDLDLSDASSDFTEFDPVLASDKKYTQNKNEDGLDSDDLDMDDLDLSDDDLSQNSLNDVDLENGDFT
ncbi:hypothetical protein ACF0H5_004740 [Mactra antiquata]